jgi:hypothetical protein
VWIPLEVITKFNSEVRKTEDRVSVYDLIEFMTGAKNPHQVYADISSRYPDVLRSAENLRFAGRGQKFTPTVDKKGAVQIIMVLPGVKAAA